MQLFIWTRRPLTCIWAFVPFDDDKKLSAKRIFNRETLQRIQEELTQYLKENGFDVQRGNKNKERKNLSVPEYKAMREELKKIETEKQEGSVAKF